VPRPLLISVRNTFRQKTRMLLTLITLALGGALFIGAFNVQVSMNNYVEKVGRYFRGDINLNLANAYRIDRVSQAVAEVPGVKYIEGWAVASAELVNADGSYGESVQVLGPPAASVLVEPILLEGRWILPGDTNAVTLNDRFLSVYPDLKVGDSVRMNIDERETEWTVVGIFQLVGNSAGNIAYTNYETLSRITGRPNQASTYRVVGDRTGMTEAEQGLLGKRIETALNAAGINVAEVQAGESMSRLASDGFAILTAFLFFLALLTALVGSIGLAGTMSMNVLERTREIGVMRAVGATNPILMRMVIVEGMLIGILSWVLGSVLAFPISKALADSISLAIFGAPSTLGVTPSGFLIWLGAVVVLATLASVLPARHATRLTIREVLAYE
jgi:putative ABC transport system permease protein